MKYILLITLLVIPNTILAATTVSGVGTGSLGLTGTGNGTIIFYYGDGSPTNFGDHNCSFGADCTWSFNATGSGYYTPPKDVFILDMSNGSCSTSTYEDCITAGAEIVGVEYGYHTNGTIWSENSAPSAPTTSTSTMSSTDKTFDILFYGIVIMYMTAWGVIGFFRKR